MKQRYVVTVSNNALYVLVDTQFNVIVLEDSSISKVKSLALKLTGMNRTADILNKEIKVYQDIATLGGTYASV
jgi:hypothetical protein